MKIVFGLLTIGANLVLLSGPAIATTEVGVFALVDDVTFEPSDRSPERIWVSGVFVIPTPHSSGLHEPPAQGHLYFSLNPKMPGQTRNDWYALKELAGTGQIIGFGEYWVPHYNEGTGDIINSSLQVQVYPNRYVADPQPYPRSNEEGLVTFFSDVPPRMGKPAREIVTSIRETKLRLTFEAEGRDLGGAEDKEAKILSQIALAGLALTHLEVQCRETICRVRLFPSSNAWLDTSELVSELDGTRGLTAFSPGTRVNSDKTRVAEIYLYRRYKTK